MTGDQAALDLGEARAPTLRPYQDQAITHTRRLLADGVRAPLVVAPTGSGKTVLAAALIAGEPNARFLFLAPRRELIHQTCRKLADVNVDHGVILAGDRRLNLYSRVQVASRDTLIARVLRKQRLTLPPFDYIIIDEAHVGLTDRLDQLLALWPGAKIIGLTATPTRSDGKALGRIYDEIVLCSTVAELTDLKFLVPARYFSVSEPDLKRVRTTAGDFNQLDLDGVMNRSELIGDIVEHWLKHASSRRTVVFATSIAHSAALTQQFIQHGVASEHVDANTPQLDREQIFERFSSGKTQVLTNCTLASIGFDLPELDCVVFARPTKSLGLYLQMLGRGLRPAPGKADCLVLDHAGNVHRHGFATDHRYWTLHGKYAVDQEKTERERKRKEQAGEKTVTCPKCKCVWSGSNQCPQCGYTFPVKAKAKLTQEGELIEINGQLYRAPVSAQKKRQFYLELAGYSELKNYSLGWAAHKYKEKYGEWPPWAWKEHVEKWGGLDPSVETARWVQSRMIAYARGQQLFKRQKQDDADAVLRQAEDDLFGERIE